MVGAIRTLHRAARPLGGLIAGTVLAAILAGCNGPENRLVKEEKVYDADSFLSRNLHPTVHFPSGLTLNFPGYVVGIEKISRSIIGPNPAVVNKYLIEHAANADDEDDLQNLRGKLFREPKAMAVTHILRYSSIGAKSPQPDGTSVISSLPGRIDACFLYSIYEKRGDLKPEATGPAPSRPCPAVNGKAINVTEKGNPLDVPAHVNAWEHGLKALDRLADYAKADIAESAKTDRPYTHLLVFAMGWNTDQFEALRNFNSIANEFARAVEGCPAPSDNYCKAAHKIRPLVIVLTWPSLWDWSNLLAVGGFDALAKLASFPIKASDAREVGFGPANYLINKALAKIVTDDDLKRDLKAKDVELKVVGVGHSFGARLLAQSARSARYLTPSQQTAGPGGLDIFFALQGAFEIDRLFDGDGRRHSCLTPTRQLAAGFNRVVLTASKGDGAVNLAFFGTYAGQHDGYLASSKEAAYCDLFAQGIMDENGACLDKAGNRQTCAALAPAPEKGRPRVLYLDASDSIKYNTHRTGGGSHSDIYRENVGRVLANLLNSSDKLANCESKDVTFSAFCQGK